ncbi:hypothetical protein EJ08DRAFT_674688 [Tothia fuscella]|uniref:Uncharacterized protein n=1 Tax=Tothia fuscella TaxID=1048955 RepID=A0A9P4P0T8_9PEZI|nr:hypothetical protein EJ08DRAFT_674688 [Tothia fuscella]
MHLNTVILPVSLLLVGSTAAPTNGPVKRGEPSVLINNYCDFAVYSWTVQTGRADQGAPDVIAAKGGRYAKPIVRPNGANPVMKMSREPYLVNENGPQPIFQLEYGHEPTRVTYDLSDVDCKPAERCPFRNHQHKLLLSPKCPIIGCSEFEVACRGAYQVAADNIKMQTCLDPTADVTLDLCLEKSPAGGYDSRRLNDIGILPFP